LAQPEGHVGFYTHGRRQPATFVPTKPYPFHQTMKTLFGPWLGGLLLCLLGCTTR
jgi:hypothetical protein